MSACAWILVYVFREFVNIWCEEALNCEIGCRLLHSAGEMVEELFLFIWDSFPGPQLLGLAGKTGILQHVDVDCLRKSERSENVTCLSLSTDS